MKQEVDAAVNTERERLSVDDDEERRDEDVVWVLRVLRVRGVARRGGVLVCKGDVGDICGRLRAEAATAHFDRGVCIGLCALGERCVVVVARHGGCVEYDDDERELSAKSSIAPLRWHCGDLSLDGVVISTLPNRGLTRLVSVGFECVFKIKLKRL